MKPIKFKITNEKITRRAGLFLVNELIKKSNLDRTVDSIFGKPGSNRGFKHSKFFNSLIAMFHDGATHLEDIRHLKADKAYQELLEQDNLPTADAIGDWLRRQGENQGERKTLQVISELLKQTDLQGNVTLDIDATVIESDKGDSEIHYTGVNGYHPLIGIIAENGIVAGSEFRQGNAQAAKGLWQLIETCQKTYGRKIKTIRSDSAGFSREVIGNCIKNKMYFSITADQNPQVREAIKSIPEQRWSKGIYPDQSKADWECAEVDYIMGATEIGFRLVVKRTPLGAQADLFTDYKYWVVATNLPENEYSALQVIFFHQKRGNMEKQIGELKHHYGLGHLPCGQLHANALYFSIGLLAYNLLQILKIIALPPGSEFKSIKTLRYQLFHLAGKLVSHARSFILKISAPIENFKLLETSFYKIRLAPQ